MLISKLRTNFLRCILLSYSKLSKYIYKYIYKYDKYTSGGLFFGCWILAPASEKLFKRFIYILNMEYSAILVTWTDLQDIFLYEKASCRAIWKVYSNSYCKKNSICKRIYASKYSGNVLNFEYQIIHGGEKSREI